MLSLSGDLILSAQSTSPNRGDIMRAMAPAPGAPPVEWRIAEGLTPYEEAVAFMEARAEAIAAGEAPELVWLVEHPPLYTAGTSAQDARSASTPAFRSTGPAAAASSPITGPASGWPMSCST